MITTTVTSGLVIVILTPIENVVLLNLEFNTHLNISKLLSSSLLCYKTNELFVFFCLFLIIPINMYSKDQKCGTSDLKCQWQVRYISNVFGHVYKCFVFFIILFFLYIYLMHWSYPRRHLCLFRYSICHGCRKASFFSFFCICTRPQSCVSTSQLHF